LELKPRPAQRRKSLARDVPPPEVPEVSSATVQPPSAHKAEPEEIPEHIRRMLEAAYT
jgi:hypothetical protein